jgi:hypothetical protein
VKAILVNIFGGIAKCDMIANGIVEASKDADPQGAAGRAAGGTNVELGKKLWPESGLASSRPTPAERPRRSSRPVKKGPEPWPSSSTRTTRVMTQGFTGAQGTFHAEQGIAYGRTTWAATTPGKGGTMHHEPAGLRPRWRSAWDDRRGRRP